jgi:hypothetical protein
MAVDRTRTLRGALAGAAAAAVWAAQQPLDKRVFGVDYDDADLLGGFVTGRRAARYPVGLALHVANGAVFGALYASAVRALPLPLPAAARGPLAGLAENLVTWPGMAVIAPELFRSPQAFAQAAWRHLLFGTVLGELERRLNPPDSEPRPVDAAAAASNGHGTAEYVVSLN